MDLYTVFIVPHAISGAIALITGIIAVITKIADVKHQWHVWSGRVFFWAMVSITATAIGLVIVRPNLFMFFIALFSFYHTWSGWRYAKNRKGIPSQLDTAVVWLALLTFIGMVGWSVYTMFVLEESAAIVATIFGIIGIVNANGARKILGNQEAKGKKRIAEHLGMMMGGFIATITAFGVINAPRMGIGYDTPAYNAVWLLPTATFVPIIFIWTNKIMGGKIFQGMEKKVEKKV